ncbi:AraC family transcriptional regulator [Eleftheria terrae]|uniref:AraC family transcriptional regulator n=1 Tax=Eleftheria terrae TaxID=1597781 RepID=UPI00263BBDD2|nr:AraC family transcriptional regulator [Eleftheria terrae]WKB50589.1 AraC family transcriptional regulator [Eleftheria terrae]
MDKEAVAPAERQADAAAVGTTSRQPPAASARVGLKLDLRTTPAGISGFEARPEHRLRLHAGAPVRGTCGQHRFTYRRGDLDIFPAGTTDVWEDQDASTSLILLLSPALLQRAADDMGVAAGAAGLEPRHQFKDKQIEHIAWALEAERRAGHPSGLLYTESLGMALAVHLLGRYRVPQRMPRQGLPTRQLQRVTEYIEAHLDQDLSLAVLAALADLSASHFKTLFKRSTGLPVHEYVVQRRVARAKALLQDGRLPASQVALEAGFAHQSHMARCMRRVLGVTPAQVARPLG